MNIYLVLLPFSGLDSSSNFYGAFSTIEQAKSVVEANSFAWAKIVDYDNLEIKTIGILVDGFHRWHSQSGNQEQLEYPQAPHMLTALIEKRELMMMNTQPLEETKKGNRL